jgi:hypothetical protein
MKTRSDIAVEKFLAGYNCAQAVLYAFCDDPDCPETPVFRLKLLLFEQTLIISQLYIIWIIYKCIDRNKQRGG